MKADPSSVSAGANYINLSVEIINTSNHDATVRAPAPPGIAESSPDQSFAAESNFIFLKNGSSATEQFSGTGPNCTYWLGTKWENHQAVRTLKPGESLLVFQPCVMKYLALVPVTNAPTPTGTYVVKWDHHLTVNSAPVGPVSVEFEVK